MINNLFKKIIIKNNILLNHNLFILEHKIESFIIIWIFFETYYYYYLNLMRSLGTNFDFLPKVYWCEKPHPTPRM